MKTSCVAVTLASFALMGQAWAEVRTLHAVQHIDPPDGYTRFAQDVAIDSRYMIVLGEYTGGQAALLYQRSTATGPFVYQRVLQSRSGASAVPAEVAMKNGIAVVRFGNQEWIFEFDGSTYVPAVTAQPPVHPGGVAISGNSILIGGNGCEYGAVIYQKGAGGVWDITGRIAEQPGSCRPEGFFVDLNYDYALLRVTDTTQATAWHRGTEFNWAFAGTLDLPADTPLSDQPFVLQNSTAVAFGNYVFRRNGTHWPSAGRALAANYYNTLGLGGFSVVYRDGVLLASEAVTAAQPYAYLETTPGHFEHVALLDAGDDTVSQDVSKNTVVVGTQSNTAMRFAVEVFQLPAPLAAASPIVNDLEARDISGFTFVGNRASWYLVKRGANDKLRQEGRFGREIAAVNGSDWTGYRRIEADITPTYVGSPTWVGLIVRYIDSNHYYYGRIDNGNAMSIHRYRDGVDTFVAGADFPPSSTVHASFADDGVQMIFTVNGIWIGAFSSPSTADGPAALVTDEAAADFDNVHVSAAEPFTLLEKDYSQAGPVHGLEFHEKGGTWAVLPDEESFNSGLAQTNPSGTALATIGTPVENQEILSTARLDAFNSANSGAWFGWVARYQDSQNYYSVAVRSAGEVQIRKTVNGVVTVLGSASFTALPGQYHKFRFRLIHDELHLLVDGVQVASAHDGTFVTGQYGVATHWAQAKWQSVVVMQP